MNRSIKHAKGCLNQMISVIDIAISMVIFLYPVNVLLKPLWQEIYSNFIQYWLFLVGILVAFDYRLFLSISPITFCATFSEQQVLVLLLLPLTATAIINLSTQLSHSHNIQNKPKYFFPFYFRESSPNIVWSLTYLYLNSFSFL